MFNIRRFEVVNFLGRGSYGDVHKYTLSASWVAEEGEDKDVAVKKLGISSDSFDVKNCSEIQTMANLSHANVVRFFGYCEVEHQIALVIELCILDLQKVIRSQRTFSEYEVAFLVNQVCQGLAYLHRNDIIHRDIKPANILIKCNEIIDVNALDNITELVLKISDFGLAKLLDEGDTSGTMTVVGTELYMAPELRDALTRKAHYSMRADVYSLGLVAYNLLKKDLGSLSSENGALVSSEIDSSILAKEGEHPTLFNNFLSACLQLDPDKRDTSAKLLQHPFLEEALFQNIDDVIFFTEKTTYTAIHYSNPNKMIVGSAEGKLIIYDMRAMTKVVKDLCEAAILSICSSDKFIAVGRSDLTDPVVILRREDYTTVKVLTNHTSRVPCILMTNEFLVTLGDDEKMFVLGVPSWNEIAEETREGFARYQCATLTGNILTLVVHRVVKQYKLTKDGCEEIVELRLNEELCSIAPDPTESNVYWVGTMSGALQKVNLNKKKVSIILKIGEGKQVLQIQHIREFVVCCLKDRKTGELGPVAAYSPGRHQRDIIDSNDIFGPLEARGEWLMHGNGRTLVQMNVDMIRDKLPINVQRHLFDNIRKSRFRANGVVLVLHFTDPDLMVLGLRTGFISVYKMSTDATPLIAKKTIMCDNAICCIDSNKEFIATMHEKQQTIDPTCESPEDPSIPLVDLTAVDRIVTILQKDNFDIVHQIGVTCHYPNINLGSNFLVVDADNRMRVFKTPGWKEEEITRFETSSYSNDRFRAAMQQYGLVSNYSTLAEDVLTFVVKRSIKQINLSSIPYEDLKNMTDLKVVSDKEEMLSCITPDSSNADEFWVGTNKGFIIKVNLEKKEILSRAKCGDGMVILQLKCLQEILLCGLSNDVTGFVFIAYDIKELSGLQSLKVPAFRQVSDMASINFETYGDLGFVFFYGSILKAVPLDEFRVVKKATTLHDDAQGDCCCSLV